jgi:hypothetical protein
MLRKYSGNGARVIVELGAWLGLSTRFLAATAPRATIVSIDHWHGSPEHHQDPALQHLLPTLYESFLVNCWDRRERIIPLRMGTIEGLREIARFKLKPDLIYIDADHSFEAVQDDLATASRLFPTAALVGDDWDWEGVRRAVEKFAERTGRTLDVEGNAWGFAPRDFQDSSALHSQIIATVPEGIVTL